MVLSTNASPPPDIGDDDNQDTLLQPQKRPPVPETIVVDFLVNLIADISANVISSSKYPAYMASALEMTFQFDRPEGESKTRVAFRARVDGGIPSIEGDNLKVIFEVKRARRGEDDIKVRAQQTMEHVAFLWSQLPKVCTILYSPCYRYCYNNSFLSLL